MIFRDLFPRAILLGTSLRYTAPVCVGEKVRATVTVRKINQEKKVVTFESVITKLEYDDKCGTGIWEDRSHNLKPT
jgi:acyl dehydratase